MNFGKELKRLRESKGMNVNQLAMYSGVSSASISRYETGERGVPKPPTIEKLAKGLRVSYEELMSKAGYFDNGEQKFEELLFRVYRFFVHSMKEEEFVSAITQLLREQGYDEKYINDLNIENYDYENLYRQIEFPDKIAFVNIFLDMFLNEDGSIKSEEIINSTISNKYNNLTGKKREMVDNMIDMLYSEQ